MIVQNTDLAYFTGTNQQAHLIVPAEGAPRLLVRRTLERAREESPIEHIQSFRSLSGLAPALAEAGAGPGARVGFELDVVSARSYLGYVRRLEGYEVVDASAAIAAVRAVKSRGGHRGHARGCGAGRSGGAGSARADAGGDDRISASSRD